MLAIDPGIRNTGWAYWETSRHAAETGVFQYSGQSDGWPRIEWFILHVGTFILAHRPKTVVIEDYVWMGKRRGLNNMLKLVGALACFAMTVGGAEVIWVTPKEKGKKRKPPKGRTQHEQDALQLRNAL